LTIIENKTLDTLVSDFVDQHDDIKHLLKTIIMSTYC